MYLVKTFCNIVGIPFSTLRYYERIGLLDPEKNGKNNYRIYTKEDGKKVNVFRYYRSLGIDTADALRIMNSEDQIEDMKKMIVTRENQIVQELFILNRQRKAMEHMEKSLEIMEQDTFSIMEQETLFFLPCTKEDCVSKLSFSIIAKWSELLPITRHSRRIRYENMKDSNNSRAVIWEYGVSISSKDVCVLEEEYLEYAVPILGSKVLKFCMEDNTEEFYRNEKIIRAIDYIKRQGYTIAGDIYLEGIPMGAIPYKQMEIVHIPIKESK